MTDESGIPTFGPREQPASKAAAVRPSDQRDPARLRISDHDRETCIDQLTRHCAEGRLSLEELDERIQGAWAARTQADLRPLSEDLPALGPASGVQPDLKSWLAEGQALLKSLPPRVLVAASAAGLVALFMLLALFAVFLGHDMGPGGHQ